MKHKKKLLVKTTENLGTLFCWFSLICSETSKKKLLALKNIWKTKAEKPLDVEEFYTTVSLAIEIIERILRHIDEFGEVQDINPELYQLQNTLDQYKAHIMELVRGKKLARHMENSLRRTKIARFNALLHSDVAMVLEVCISSLLVPDLVGEQYLYAKKGKSRSFVDANAP